MIVAVGLGSLLSNAVHVEEAAGASGEVVLRPDEAHFVSGAVGKRRREFAVGRSLAHRALGSLGSDVGPIGVGPKREPVWPEGVVGSITHCDGYAASAVASIHQVRSLGIDAEPAEPLPADVVELIASPRELERLAGWEPEALRLLFSAKESIYKAWFPISQRWLGFEDCDLTLTPDHATGGSFVGRIGRAAIDDDADVDVFNGRYDTSNGVILTAVEVPPGP